MGWGWLIAWLPFLIPSDNPEAGVYPKDYFAPPVDIQMYLSGTFGELRSNHFHSGIDIKTQGREGLPIYAIADGYVSRIKVSPYGYGKAVYVTHPNGFTSVYGHLSEYSGAIGKAVEQYQYEQESFAIEIFPDPSSLLVKKGEQIALSGNTGGSGGPHLHFEIRNTESEIPINPLLFGYDIKDDLVPTTTRLYIYGYEPGQRNPAPKSYSIYGGKVADTILVDGTMAGIAIDAYDQLNGATNKNGVYALSMTVDGQPWMYMDFEQFGFHETRYLNAMIDYCQYQKNRNRFYRLFKLPANLLSVYKLVRKDGFVPLSTKRATPVQIDVADAYGNTSTVTCWLKRKKTPASPVFTAGKILPPTETYHLEYEGIDLTIPAMALYDTIRFEWVKQEGRDQDYSARYELHTDCEPVQYFMNLSLKTENLPDSLRDKALLVRLASNGRSYAEGGTWKDGWVQGNVRSFGTFTVQVDNENPSIRPYSIPRPGGTIKFSISDDLSGIEDYDAWVDDQWILMEYDAKRALLEGRIPADLASGEHLLKLVVRDERKNVATYSTTFNR